jgi:hypothetical protein
LKLIVHVIFGIIIGIMLAGILLVLTLPISGKAQLALAGWGILLAIIGAIVGALFGAGKRKKDQNED